MKKLLAVLLVISVAANAAWLVKSSVQLSHLKSKSLPAATVAPKPGNLLPAALASGDPAALAAAGFSPADIRAFTLGRVVGKYFELLRAARPKVPGDKYWRNTTPNFNRITPEQQLAMSKAERALSEGLHSVYGDDDPFDMAGYNRMKFLPTEKQDKIHQIQKDYDDMTQEITAQSNGVMLASDRAQLKLLDQEKARDMAAAMSPEEREQYELESSSTAATIRNRYGDAIQSEDDYKKVFALQKAFDDQYGGGGGTSGPPTPDQVRAQADAQNQLNQDIRSAIGDDNYAAFQRANDPEYRTLNSLETRLNLPAATADQIYAARDAYAVQSQQIAAQSGLTTQQRRDQYSALADQAKADLVAKLGQEGADAYVSQSNWMKMLTGGGAFSTNPADAPPGSVNGSGSTVYRYRAKAAAPGK